MAGNKKRTTVILTERGRQLKCHYSAMYGLKELLSAGLELFDALDAEQREALIRRVATEGTRSPADAAEYAQGKADARRAIAKANAADSKRRRKGG